MSQNEKPQGLKIIEVAITVSALFMVLIGLILYFYHDAISLDKGTAKTLAIACVGFAVFELVVVKKLFIRAMSQDKD